MQCPPLSLAAAGQHYIALTRCERQQCQTSFADCPPSSAVDAEKQTNEKATNTAGAQVLTMFVYQKE